MQKEEIVRSVISVLEMELATATQAAKDSASEATDDESRPENKYDTRGLEASYVATAQAHYAKDLIEALQAYRNLNVHGKSSSSPIAIGCLVTTLSSSGRETFFIGPARGGLEVQAETGLIVVLTPSSPLGSMLIGKTIGGKTRGPIERTVIRIE